MMQLTKAQIFALIPPPKNTTEVTYEDGNTKDIISEVVAEFKNSWKQTEKLAPYLKGKSDAETADNIWKFIKYNVKYKIDKEPYQWVKSPSRTLHDGFADCKSYSILALSLLKNMGIKGSFKFVSLFSHKDIHHVYVIIDKCCCNGGVYIPIDAVISQPLTEKKPIYQEKIITMAEIHRLEGIGGIGSITSVLGQQLETLKSSIHRIENPQERQKELEILNLVINNLNTQNLAQALQTAFLNSGMPEFYKALITSLAVLSSDGTINGIGFAPALALLAHPKARQIAMKVLGKAGEVGKKLIGDRQNCGGFGKLFKTKKCKAKQAAQQAKVTAQQRQEVAPLLQVSQNPDNGMVVSREITPAQGTTPANTTSTTPANTQSNTSNGDITPTSGGFFEKNKTLIYVAAAGAVLYMVMGSKKSGVSGVRRRKKAIASVAGTKRRKKRTTAPKRKIIKRRR